MGQAATEDEPTLSTSISRHLRKGGHVVFGIIAAGRGPSRLCRLSDVLQAAGNGVRSGFILVFSGLGVLGEEAPVFLEREHHFGWLVLFDVRVRIQDHEFEMQVGGVVHMHPIAVARAQRSRRRAAFRGKTTSTALHTFDHWTTRWIAPASTSYMLRSAVPPLSNIHST